MKRVLGIYGAQAPHWVGDGFPVRSLFSYGSHGQQISPFLMLDYASPTPFSPASVPRGIGSHPHRGMETVTIVYQGELAHRDSTGGGGVIGPGDVQWMTAGAGILHEEFHSPEFTRTGGVLEMAQLWVNLPARDKMTRPGYQAIGAGSIPTVTLPGDAGQVRVIAGDYDGEWGPARTHSQMQVWDMRLKQGGVTRFDLQAGWGVTLVVLRGSVIVNGDGAAQAPQTVVLDAQGQGVVIEASSDATVLLLSGQPLNEPIVGHGPFVMNTKQEIAEAIDDFNQGRFGQQ